MQELSLSARLFRGIGVTGDMSKRRLLVLKMGSAHPDVIGRCGDYDQWFARSLGAWPRRSEMDIVVHDAERRSPVPGTEDCVIITGSRHAVYEPLGWLEPAARYLEQMMVKGKPMLGVCFGHQLIARILGARVARNPHGVSMGPSVVELTNRGTRDPLFTHIPRRFVVHETHADVVLEPPAGVDILLKSPVDAFHGFRIGEKVWTLQFHPEMGELEMDAVLQAGGANADRSIRVGDMSGVSRTGENGGDTGVVGERILWRFMELALF